MQGWRLKVGWRLSNSPWLGMIEDSITSFRGIKQKNTFEIEFCRENERCICILLHGIRTHNANDCFPASVQLDTELPRALDTPLGKGGTTRRRRKHSPHLPLYIPTPPASSSQTTLGPNTADESSSAQSAYALPRRPQQQSAPCPSAPPRP